ADERARFAARDRGTDYLGVEHDVIRIYDPQPPPHLLGWPPSGTFVQPEVEAVLRAGAARSGQADVFLATQAVAFTAHADRVDVVLRGAGGAGGAERTIAARCLVGCDGAHSFGRRQLRIRPQGPAFDEWGVVVHTPPPRPLPPPP